MQRVFNKLYQLSVLHTFYEKNESEDFAIIPMGRSTRLMRALGIVCRTNTKGFELYYNALNESGDPVIPLTENHTLTFGIELKNENAHYFTAFPDKTNNSDIYYCSGAYNDASLSLSAMATRQPAFTEIYTYDTAMVTFKVLDASGNKCFEASQTGTQNQEDPSMYDFSFSVDFGTNFEMGVFVLQTFKNGILADEDEVYIFDRFSYSNLIGVLELEIDGDMDYTAVPYLTSLEFSASSSLWKYKIEISRDFINATLSITNSDKESTISFGAPTTVADYEVGEVITFESSEEITKSELPITAFSLEVTSDEIDLTLAGLPNPSHHNSNSTVYLKI